jgi:hypothetical protein
MTVTIDVTAGRLGTTNQIRLAPRNQSRDRAVDQAFSAGFKDAYSTPVLNPADAKRPASSFEDAVWGEEYPKVDDDYRIGAEGAWLMSTGAGESLGASIGASLAIEPVSL